MLAGVNYAKLNEQDLSELEAAIMKNLAEFISYLCPVLFQAKVMATPKFMIGYLSAYLSSLTSKYLGLIKAEWLKVEIEELICTQVEYSYAIFSKYPLNVLSEECRPDYLQQLRKEIGGIADYTSMLITILDASIISLEMNADRKKLLSPLDPVFVSSISKAVEESVKYKKYSGLYIINQTLMQIGWIAGYYARLDPKYAVLDYLLYIIASMDKYIKQE